jgi:hypothetical protein
MTTEVAVLNKTGVAIAADSAVTTGFPGREKIFTTANKIFTLSKVEPVGIMINGHVEHFGCPWEVIVKDFRERLKATAFDDLEEYATRFLKAVVDPKFLNSDAQAASVIHIALSTYWEVHRRVFDRPNSRWRVATIKTRLEEMEKEASAWSVIAGFDEITGRKFNTEYGAIIDDVLSGDEFIPLEMPKACRSLFKSVARLAAISERQTQFSTGIVIVGFGRENLYPKLIELTVDGGCLNHVRHFEIGKADIKDDPDGAIVLAFAQDDTVNSFTRGIDEKFTLFDTGLFTHFMELIVAEILKEHTTLTREERMVTERMVHRRMSEAFEDFQSEISDFATEEYEKPMLDVLRTAPKETLAELAESLVSITSLRQRVSGDLETVGGPVDVALISKGEGFIWIKRKHYFDKELNPHYVRNYFREVEHGKEK